MSETTPDNPEASEPEPEQPPAGDSSAAEGPASPDDQASSEQQPSPAAEDAAADGDATDAPASVEEAASEQEPPASDDTADQPAAGAAPGASLARRPDLAQLSLYAKTLLKIRVPTEVSLASKKMAVREVVELGPGSIIQFSKPCDEMLNLTIGRVQVAEGEAVKVGEKFGLRITSITLPAERFKRADA